MTGPNADSVREQVARALYEAERDRERNDAAGPAFQSLAEYYHGKVNAYVTVLDLLGTAHIDSSGAGS